MSTPYQKQVRSGCGRGFVAGGGYAGRYDAGPVFRRYRRLVFGGVRRTHPGPGAGLAGHRRRGARAHPRPHRVGENPGRLPLRPGPPADRAGTGNRPPLPGPLHLPDESPGPRRGTQPARPPARNPHRGRPGGAGAPVGGDGRHPHRRHPARRKTAHATHPARHPHHHPRVFLPVAHQLRPGDVGVGAVGDPGRGACGGRLQTRIASGPVLGAAGGVDPATAATDRPVRHPASPGSGGRIYGGRRPPPRSSLRTGPHRPRLRPDPRRGGRRATRGRGRLETAAGYHRGHPRRPGAGCGAGGAGGGHGRPRSPRPVAVGPRPPRLSLHLAIRLSEGPRTDPGPPLHHRVRQLAPPGRKTVRRIERPGRRGDNPRPSRVGLPGASPANRGNAETGAPACGGGHIHPGVGNRHGSGGFGDPDRIPRQRDLRPAANGAGRASGGGGQHGQNLPQIPGRPAGGDGGGRPVPGRTGGSGIPSPPSLGCAGPADRGRNGHGTPERGRPVPTGAAGRPLPGSGKGPLRVGAGYAGRTLPGGTVRRVAPPPGMGPHNRDFNRPLRSSSAGGRQPGNHPRPGLVYGQPAGRSPGGRVGRRNGVRVPTGGRVHPGGLRVAHHRHHRRPGGSGSRPGRGGGANALLEGRPGGTAPGNGAGHRPLHRPHLRPGTGGGGGGTAGKAQPGRVGGPQPGFLPGRRKSDQRDVAHRPHPGGAALPGRGGRLADRPAVGPGGQSACSVGDGPGPPTAGTLRAEHGHHLERRRHFFPLRGRRGGAVGGGTAAGPRRSGNAAVGGVAGHRPVRGPVPGGRRPGPAPAPPPPRRAHPAVATTAPGRRPDGGGRPLRFLPDRAGNVPGNPAGRVRRARPAGSVDRFALPQNPHRGGGNGKGRTFRIFVAVRIRRRLHLRGGRPPGRTAGDRPHPGPEPVAGTAGGRGASGTAGPGGDGRGGNGTATADPRPPGAGGGRGGGPADGLGPAYPGRSGRPVAGRRRHRPPVRAGSRPPGGARPGSGPVEVGGRRRHGQVAGRVGRVPPAGNPRRLPGRDDRPVAGSGGTAGPHPRPVHRRRGGPGPGPAAGGGGDGAGDSGNPRPSGERVVQPRPPPGMGGRRSVAPPETPQPGRVAQRNRGRGATRLGAVPARLAGGGPRRPPLLGGVAGCYRLPDRGRRPRLRSGTGRAGRPPRLFAGDVGPVDGLGRGGMGGTGFHRPPGRTDRPLSPGTPSPDAPALPGRSPRLGPARRDPRLSRPAGGLFFPGHLRGRGRDGRLGGDAGGTVGSGVGGGSNQRHPGSPADPATGQGAPSGPGQAPPPRLLSARLLRAVVAGVGSADRTTRRHRLGQGLDRCVAGALRGADPGGGSGGKHSRGDDRPLSGAGRHGGNRAGAPGIFRGRNGRVAIRARRGGGPVARPRLRPDDDRAGRRRPGQPVRNVAPLAGEFRGPGFPLRRGVRDPVRRGPVAVPGKRRPTGGPADPRPGSAPGGRRGLG